MKYLQFLSNVASLRGEKNGERDTEWFSLSDSMKHILYDSGNQGD